MANPGVTTAAPHRTHQALSGSPLCRFAMKRAFPRYRQRQRSAGPLAKMSGPGPGQVGPAPAATVESDGHNRGAARWWAKAPTRAARVQTARRQTARPHFRGLRWLCGRRRGSGGGSRSETGPAGPSSGADRGPGTRGGPGPRNPGLRGALHNGCGFARPGRARGSTCGNPGRVHVHPGRNLAVDLAVSDPGVTCHLREKTPLPNTRNGKSRHARAGETAAPGRAQHSAHPKGQRFGAHRTTPPPRTGRVNSAQTAVPSPAQNGKSTTARDPQRVARASMSNNPRPRSASSHSSAVR